MQLFEGLSWLSTAATVATFLRGGLRTGKVNGVALARYRDLEPDGIIALVAIVLPVITRMPRTRESVAEGELGAAAVAR